MSHMNSGASSQTTLPEDTPSQGLLSRKSTRGEASHPLRDEDTVSAAPPAYSHSAQLAACAPELLFQRDREIQFGSIKRADSAGAGSN